MLLNLRSWRDFESPFWTADPPAHSVLRSAPAFGRNDAEAKSQIFGHLHAELITGKNLDAGALCRDKGIIG